MNQLPSRFLRVTASKNQLVRRLERLRTSKTARQQEGHVLVQGIKTLEELASKGNHHIRTIGITFDEHNLPIRKPALTIAESVHHQEQQNEDGTTRREGEESSRQQEYKMPFKADTFVAMSQKLTTKILGTDSPTSTHEVWAEVAIPDYEHLFSEDAETTSPLPSNLPPGALLPEESRPAPRRAIKRLLVLDQISDPGNMGLIIRSAKALSWDAAWHTPGTVDQYNDKVVRASRALCLDWPTKTGKWAELEMFLRKNSDMTLLVADMVPRWITDRAVSQLRSAHSVQTATQSKNHLNPYKLVWWNWPTLPQRNQVPKRIALVMSSEHHGVRAIPAAELNDFKGREEQDAKARLLKKAIRVSIPMNPDVESMNVAAAATAMMWELNQILDEHSTDNLQIFDEPK